MKILYFIHNDWNWIKQRSHFLIQELSEKASVHVISKKSFKTKNLIKNNAEKIGLSLPLIPFCFHRIRALRFLEFFIYRALFKTMHKMHKYDFIIFSHPILIQYLKWHKRLVYDMHDDNACFYKPGSFLNLYIKELNIYALKKSTCVIFSSNFLFSKYKEKAKRSYIVPNGHNIKFSKKIKTRKLETVRKRICYFGTISEWFDTKLIFSSVINFSLIDYDIIGPVDIKKIEHERIHWIKPMAHKEMLRFASQADCFVMPFIRNDLINGVDPVKLYEYISFHKPIISVFYDELERYKPFVYFYSNKKEYFNLIEKLTSNILIPKGSVDERKIYLESSTWKKRANELFRYIMSEH